jgi:hypothetical protein
VYEPRKEMTRGSPAPVTAAVTLERSALPSKVLRRPGAAEETGVVVSCLLQARLTASKYQFDLDEKGWIERSFLTTDTARWSWYATPKVGGTHTLVLNVRPIVKLRPTDDKTRSLASIKGVNPAEDSNVQQYETSVHVNVPWTERPQETMSRLAATFKIAESLVAALTALIVAVVALGAVLGIRSRRNKRATS